jgi:hypothetical protein
MVYGCDVIVPTPESSAAYACTVKKREILRSGEPADASARGGTNPPQRILVTDGNRGILQTSATVVIRHAKAPARTREISPATPVFSQPHV